MPYIRRRVVAESGVEVGVGKVSNISIGVNLLSNFPVIPHHVALVFSPHYTINAVFRSQYAHRGDHQYQKPQYILYQQEAIQKHGVGHFCRDFLKANMGVVKRENQDWNSDKTLQNPAHYPVVTDFYYCGMEFIFGNLRFFNTSSATKTHSPL
jgi:hypothetical protein